MHIVHGKLTVSEFIYQLETLSDEKLCAQTVLACKLHNPEKEGSCVNRTPIM
jgi:hypothetical protein